MFLKTFKGRILAVSLGMTIVSVGIFGYGLAGIYYQHMHKCLNRSLTFLTNMLAYEYDLSKLDEGMREQIERNPQLITMRKGGLIDDLRYEVLAQKPHSNEQRIYRSKRLPDGTYFAVSSSSAKIDGELVEMIASRWIYFLFGFLFTSALIYFLIRHLFAPFNQLVNHCLTCDDPDKKPQKVSGGVEIIALRDAIATLQQRISRLQSAQYHSMKALTHELKTPLARLRLRIDLADQKNEWKSGSISAARDEIDAIAEKITQILHRVEHTEKTEKIDLGESIETLIEELRDLCEHRGVKFEVDLLPPAVLPLPRASFERVMRIAVENALNHAASESSVLIRYRGGVLEIENTIGYDKHRIIPSSGKGIEIAKTLCAYYGWEFNTLKRGERYRCVLTLTV
jgi:signal transduction histidine kinase